MKSTAVIVLLLLLLLGGVATYFAIAASKHTWPFQLKNASIQRSPVFSAATVAGAGTFATNGIMSGTIDPTEIRLSVSFRKSSGTVSYIKTDNVLELYFSISASECGTDKTNSMNIDFDLNLPVEPAVAAGSILPGGCTLSRPFVSSLEGGVVGEVQGINQSNMGSVISLASISPLTIRLTYIWVEKTSDAQGLIFSGSCAIPIKSTSS